VRAKRKIKDAGIPYRVPDDDVLEERQEAVLAVLYLVFNEGYRASTGDALVRHELADEAIRLVRLFIELMPYAAEAKGLLALCLFHHSRRRARVDDDGDLRVLEEQDRSLWDRVLIDDGRRVLADAMRQNCAGPYQIEAAIAATHVRAPRSSDTDWRTVLMLYDALVAMRPTPIVELNRAVAVAFARGIEHALPILDDLASRGALSSYHLLHAARADLLRRRGDFAHAVVAYERALETVTSAVERRYLTKRRDACAQRT